MFSTKKKWFSQTKQKRKIETNFSPPKNTNGISKPKKKNNNKSFLTIKPSKTFSKYL